MLQKTWDDSLLLTRCWTISSFHRFFNCEDERNTELDSEESDIQWFYNLNSLVWWHKRENPTGKEFQWGPRPHWASDVWGLCTMCWLECHLKMVSHNSITLQVWSSVPDPWSKWNKQNHPTPPGPTALSVGGSTEDSQSTVYRSGKCHQLNCEYTAYESGLMHVKWIFLAIHVVPVQDPHIQSATSFHCAINPSLIYGEKIDSKQLCVRSTWFVGV